MKKILTLAFSICVAMFNIGSPVRAAAQITVGSDFNVSRMAGTELDMTVTVSPADSSKVCMFSTHFGGTAGMFRAYSNDGGTSWTASLIAAGNDLMQRAQGNFTFPSAAFDQFGNLFVVYNNVNDNPVVAWSFDGGVTFQDLVPSAPLELDTTGARPFPKICIGPGPTNLTSAVWICYDRNGSIGVNSFETQALGVLGPVSPQRVITAPRPNNGGNFNLSRPSIAVGPKGQVAVAAETTGVNNSASQIMIAVDNDGVGPGGFGLPTLLTSSNVGLNYNIPAAQIHPNINLVYDQSSNAYSGRLYAVYTDEFPPGSDNTDIVVRYSDNNGATFATANTVNADGSLYSQFMPTAAVDLTTGALSIVWVDCRADTGASVVGQTNTVDHDMRANTDGQIFGCISTDGGVTFNNPQFQVSAGSSEDTANGFGEYLGLGYVNNVHIVGWSDNSNSTGDNPDGALNNSDFYVCVDSVKPGTTTPPPPPRPDLVITNVALATTPPLIAGVKFNLTVTVLNQGPGKSNNFFVSAFNDPNTAVFQDTTVTNFNLLTNFNNSDPTQGCTPEFAASKKVSVVEVPGGLSPTTTVDVTLEMIYCDAGDYRVAILADSQSNVLESHDDNNKVEFSVSIAPNNPDLTISRFIATTTTAPNFTTTFTTDVKNLGIRPSGPVTLGIYYNRLMPPTSLDKPDATFAFANFTGVGTAGATQTATFALPQQPIARAGRAWVFIDYSNSVVEGREDNNVQSAVWGVTNDPPAILSALTATPQPANSNSNVTFTVVAGDPNGDTLNYVWDFGDGTPPVPAGASVLHAYAAPGFFTTTVTVSDGPYNFVQSSVKVEILDSNIVDLGFVVARSGYVKLNVPLPPGFIARDRPKGKIVEGSAGANIKFSNGRLTGKGAFAGTYTFTIDYLSVKAKKAGRVRYKFTVIN